MKIRTAVFMSVLLLALVIAPAAGARPIRDPVLDQEQAQWIGAIWFGEWAGVGVVAQSFVPSLPGREICRITVSLLDTWNLPGPGPLAVAEIWSDEDGEPGELLGVSLNGVSSDVTNSYLVDYNFYFDGPRQRGGDKPLWLLLRADPNTPGSPFGVGWWHNEIDAYPQGQMLERVYGEWQPVIRYNQTGDMRFSEWVC